jgi:hypothetical protein
MGDFAFFKKILDCLDCLFMKSTRLGVSRADSVMDEVVVVNELFVLFG